MKRMEEEKREREKKMKERCRKEGEGARGKAKDGRERKRVDQRALFRKNTPQSPSAAEPFLCQEIAG